MKIRMFVMYLKRAMTTNVTVIALQTAASSIIMIITFLQEESRSSEQFFKQLAPFAAVVHP